jgi:predicted dehydrogenase
MDHDGGIDRDCAAVLTFPGGGIGVMDATFRLPWLQAPLEVHGDRGVLRLHNAYNPGTSRCAATLTWKGAKPEAIEFAGMNMYRAMVKSFSESYRTGAPLAYPPEASLATATAITLVRVSSGKFADA